eukprot:99353-Chlamydomonas_euryale.AAC.2
MRCDARWETRCCAAGVTCCLRRAMLCRATAMLCHLQAALPRRALAPVWRLHLASRCHAPAMPCHAPP